jgi:hypothetical protein
VEVTFAPFRIDRFDLYLSGGDFRSADGAGNSCARAAELLLRLSTRHLARAQTGGGQRNQFAGNRHGGGFIFRVFAP